MRKDKNEQNEIARPVGKHFAQVDDSKAEPCCAETAAPAFKVRKRLWAVAVLLCAVAIATGTYLTYTAFLAGDFLKSVAVSGTSQALFASDMLTGYTNETLNDEGIAVRSVIADTSGKNCSFTFRIYNHLLGDKNKVNDKDVNATLSVKATGTTDWSISGSPTLTAGGTVDLSFPANRATMYTYKVTFSKADLNKASFTVKAKVGSNSPGTNLKWLAAKIAPSERAEVTASGVSGEWVDKNKDDTNVGDFDAYNYRVTVTGATTKVELTWGSGVELDPFFEANHKNCVKQETVSGHSVTYDASPGSEIITFYRKGDSKPTSWEAIGVSCSAA
ncbi:MAG: hypothetical protein UE003_06885 [Collinsella sp.]|nr:hypothetical protein [Collinsella sp.]